MDANIMAPSNINKLIPEIPEKEGNVNILNQNSLSVKEMKADLPKEESNLKQPLENENLNEEEEMDKEEGKKTKKKIVKCHYPGCERTYRTLENLHLHILNFHKKIKPYHCSYCDASFSHRNGKIYHERKVHTLDLRYLCNYPGCQLKFPCKSALTCHIKYSHLHIKVQNKKEQSIKEETGEEGNGIKK